MTAGVGLYQQSQMSSAAKILVIISDADRIVPAGAVAQRFVCVSACVYIRMWLCAFVHLHPDSDRCPLCCLIAASREIKRGRLNKKKKHGERNAN